MKTEARTTTATASAPGGAPDWESLRPKVTESLLAVITRRIVERFDPECIILFGSYAYGTPTAYSDLDLFVIMESDEPLFPRIGRVAAAAKIPFLPMDVIVRTPAEVEQRLQMGDSFTAEILNRGRVLYERAG